MYYWIVDADAGTVEVFRAPASDGYRDSRRLARDGVIAPLVFPDLTIRVADLFA